MGGLHRGFEEVVGCFEALGDYADFADGGHKVCVAVPAGDDMPMDVAGDARSAGSAEVDADVETVGMEHFGYPVYRRCDQLVDFKKFLVGEFAEVGGVFVGCDHKVATGVGVSVEDDEGGMSSEQDEVIAVVGLGGEIDEDTAVGVFFVGALDVFEPPGCPKLIDHWFILSRGRGEGARIPVENRDSEVEGF